MKPMLTAFIDGLKPESTQYMSFLNSLPTKRRITTDLGYSLTCHASMYSGLYPNKHLHWFIWKYSPATSPFKWLRKTGLERLPDNIYFKYACWRLSRILFNRGNTAAFSLPFLWYMPLRHWAYFDVAEKRFWSDSGFLESYPTIFELLKANHLPYDIVGMKREHLSHGSRIVAEHHFDRIKPWTYLFIGEIDPLSHEYGQDSSQTIEKLREIDHILEKVHRLFERKLDDFYFLCFSDHGHIVVKGKIDLEAIFKAQGRRLGDYIYFIDSNYARFWFRGEGERKEVSQVLSVLSEKGFILTDELMERFKVNMPDNRYGDMIFYLDAPYIFNQGNVYIMGRERTDLGKYISMHGFSPDHPDSDGVFISNKEVMDESHVKLQDIMPSILDVLDINIPDCIDGRVFWK